MAANDVLMRYAGNAREGVIHLIRSADYRDYLPLYLGEVVATRGAMDALNDNRTLAMPYLIRHSSGDWGDVSDYDQQLNNDALVDGGRILSAYTLDDGQCIRVITEADRSVTTVLLPSEH